MGGKQSHCRDAATQLDDLESDIYKSIAVSTVRKNREHREKGRVKGKSQRWKSGGCFNDKETLLPPLRNPEQQQTEKQQRQVWQRPRSKSVGGGGEHRVSGGQREKGGAKLQYKSHWESS